ncbi:nitrate- and nitrite sensing domain-containing protein [Streptomyces sp. NPDC001034]|uniref:sensor histidine kinase n=1 Tax=Streptomyces sp. NPDC001034 TaxID=3154375 RepID=UPI0033218494
MRFRGKSIRRKIVALLLVPLLSLTAIWGFATVVTGRDVAQLFRVSDVMQNIGYPTEDTVRVLEQERRQTLVYLADPRAADSLPALQRTRTATDRAIAKIRENARERHLRHGLGTQGSEHLTAVLDAFNGLDSLRHSAEGGTISRAQALDLYNRVIDPCYSLLGGLDGIDDVEMDKQSHALVNLTRARELLSREDALLGSALVVGRLTREETREISDLVAQRTLLYDISLPLLPAAERERYERFWTNAGTAPLRSAEQSVIENGSGTPGEVTAKSWDSAAGSALAGLGTLDDQASDRFQDRMHPVAMRVIAQGAVAGLLGLLALLSSLVLSVRIGRGLIRDLRRLRREAHEAAGVRLPGVMRRLSAGEQIDVETEVPRLEYDKNEIGEVGHALNTLQRAAVEAAVKQSELRAGVSEVFVNLARRSQVLLHKQLTLLDTMERRTEDTDELADLFRLDHLTTRMRRHAEGLVILSGAAPSRQWRRPVQLMDVVRAAVAEVEDYERVEVRRLPRVAVTGPAVADLTHLVAELLENATVFSPPHTAVQVIGERVANGFTLEIHDRGLGMTPEALLDNNLRLAETPEFELSDTDRLGLFVVSRLAQRQNVRVSLQPSPYGGTTAIVFIPDVLLSDEVPDTNGIGFRLDRERTGKNSGRAVGGSRAPLPLSGLPTTVLDGPVELESPVDLDALDDFPGALPDEDSERGGLFRHRRALTRADGPDGERGSDRPAGEDSGEHGLVPLPGRRPPKLVSSHGRPVSDQRGRRDDTDADPGDRDAYGADREPHRPGREPDRADLGGPAPLPRRAKVVPRPAEPAGRVESGDLPAPADGIGSAHRLDSADGIGPAHRLDSADRLEPAAHRLGPVDRPGPREAPPATGPRPARTADGDTSEPGDGALPRRVRQASLAPQLRQDPERRTGRGDAPADRDADEVRSRMASLQRGWQRGREENATGETARTGTAQGTTKGDGR